MRRVVYHATLSEPYTISNIPSISALTNMGEEERIKCPGIRMIVEDCQDIDQFYGSFRYIAIDGSRPKFARQFPRVLRGEDLSWKLTNVDIDCSEIRLVFKNEQLFKKFCDRKARCNFSPPAFYSEMIESYRPNTGARIRFDVSSPHGAPPTQYVVEFWKSWKTSVTEFDGDKRRTFTFHLGEGLYKYPVEITEWMQ